MVWYDTFDDAFWLAIVPMVLGVVALCLKSKCSRCTIGCITIERDIAAEIQAEQNALTQRQETRAARERTAVASPAPLEIGTPGLPVHEISSVASPAPLEIGTPGLPVREISLSSV